ncbi:MAG: hypothetical protein HYZ29_03230 [Myxococcales bacterium]|nr:hypothetical protein [Myxococcales bacterium]
MTSGGSSSGGTASGGAATGGGPAGGGTGGGAAGSPAGGTSGGGTGGSAGAGGSGGSSSGGGGGTGGVVSACPPGGVETLQDTFSAALDGATWDSYTDTTGTIVATGGALVVKPAMSGQNYNGIISTKKLSLDGCALWIEAKQTMAPSFEGETYLMAMVDGSMDAEITATPDTASPSKMKLVFGVEENGVEDNQSIPFDPPKHRWWRMRFPAGKVAFDTSPDGKNWTQRRIAARPAGMKVVQIEIGAGTWQAHGTQPVALFDNLNTVP